MLDFGDVVKDCHTYFDTVANTDVLSNVTTQIHSAQNENNNTLCAVPEACDEDPGSWDTLDTMHTKGSDLLSVMLHNSIRSRAFSIKWTTTTS